MCINDKYFIKKDDILKKYNSINNFYMDCLLTLYGEPKKNITLYPYSPFNIIKPKGDNNYSCLDALEGKTGVYIFIDNKRFPVYIGIGGKKLDGQNLKTRVSQELNVYVEKGSTQTTIYAKNSGATLSKNIQEIDSLLLNTSILPDNSMKTIKSLYLLVIPVGSISNQTDVTTSKCLETILIALFHPKYNK